MTGTSTDDKQETEDFLPISVINNKETRNGKFYEVRYIVQKQYFIICYKIKNNNTNNSNTLCAKKA